MPANTNGVYQDRSTPGKSNHGVGKGAAYPVNGAGSMGKSQYGMPVSKHSGSPSRGHENKNNSTYK